MKKWMTVLTLAGAIALSGYAFADHDHDDDHGHGHGKGNPHARHDDDQWEHRGNYDYHVFEGDSRPPGWSKGKKTGWASIVMVGGDSLLGFRRWKVVQQSSFAVGGLSSLCMHLRKSSNFGTESRHR